MIDLRARYYDPANGRFLSQDAWQGDQKIPMSYNPWLYTYANPVNLTDPSGRRSGDLRSNSCELVKDPNKRAICFIRWGCKRPEAPKIDGLDTPESQEALKTYIGLWAIPGWWNDDSPYIYKPLDFLELLLTHEFRDVRKFETPNSLLTNVSVGNFYYYCDDGLHDKPEGGCAGPNDKNTIKYIGDRHLFHFGAKDFRMGPDNFNPERVADLGYLKEKQKLVNSAKYSQVFGYIETIAHSDFSRAIAYPFPEYRNWVSSNGPMEWGNLSAGYINKDLIGIVKNPGSATNQYIAGEKGGDSFYILSWCQVNYFRTDRSSAYPGDCRGGLVENP